MKNPDNIQNYTSFLKNHTRGQKKLQKNCTKFLLCSQYFLPEGKNTQTNPKLQHSRNATHSPQKYTSLVERTFHLCRENFSLCNIIMIQQRACYEQSFALSSTKEHRIMSKRVSSTKFQKTTKKPEKKKITHQRQLQCKLAWWYCRLCLQLLMHHYVMEMQRKCKLKYAPGNAKLAWKSGMPSTWTPVWVFW